MASIDISPEGVLNIPLPSDPNGVQQAVQRAQTAAAPQARPARPQVVAAAPQEEEEPDIQGILNECGLAVAEAYNSAASAVEDGLVLVVALDNQGYYGAVQRGGKDLQTWTADRAGLGALLNDMVIYLQQYERPSPKKVSRFGKIRSNRE